MIVQLSHPSGSVRVGELTVQSCRVLHFLENGAVRKFYQTMLIRFVADLPVAAGQETEYWTVTNWGAHSEAHPGDIRGQMKVELHSSEFGALQANDRKVREKTRGGYQPHADFPAEYFDPPLAIMKEIGAVVWRRTAGAVTPTLVTPVNWPNTDTEMALKDLAMEMSDLANSTLTALASGDVGQAVARRQTLLDLLSSVQTLHETAAGQVEVLNAKFRAEISA